MPKKHPVRDALHEATHRMPGVPDHQDLAKGHQGATGHGASLQGRPPESHGTASHHGAAPAHGRPPRVMAGWQNWIARLLSRRPA